MGLPTFDFVNIIRGIKSTILTTLTSRVGTLFAIVTIIGASFAAISTLITSFVFPLVDLSSFQQDIMGLTNNDFTEIARYCARLDLIDKFLNFWIASIVGLFSFITSTMLGWFIAITVYKIKSALRADIKDK